MVHEQRDISGNLLLYNGLYIRHGQRLFVRGQRIQKLSFPLKKVGAPTGNITFAVRKVSDDSVIVNKILCDASALSVEVAWYEVIFDTVPFVDEEVRICTEFSGGDIDNCIQVYFDVPAVSGEKHAIYTASWNDDIIFAATYSYSYDPCLSIETNTDDCLKDPTIPYFSHTDPFAAGYQNASIPALGSAGRFLNCPIPPGATISDARLRLTASASLSNMTVNTRLRCQKAANPATFSTEADFDARTWTTAYVNWDNIAAWTQDEIYISPDIKSLIQEVVDQDDWKTGNAIVVLWDDWEQRSTQSNGRFRTAYSHDGDADKAPQLYVVFDILGVKYRVTIDWLDQAIYHEQTTDNGFTCCVREDQPRVGQKLTIPNRIVSKLSFSLRKIGDPSGNLTFTIRKVSDDSIVASKVWGDVSGLTTSFQWKEATFDNPIKINAEVRLCAEGGSGWNAENYIQALGHSTSVREDENYAYYTDSWHETSADMCYKYAHQVTSSYGNVTGDYKSIKFTRGKDDELGHPESGTCDLFLTNHDLKYSPENDSSPLYPYVRPGKIITITAFHDGIQCPLYRGRINRIVPHPHPTRSEVYLYCVDDMDILMTRRISTQLYKDTPTGTLINVILDAIGWDADRRSIQPGTVAPNYFTCHEEFAMEKIHQLEDLEGGLFYVDGEGVAVWEDRYYRSKPPKVFPQYTVTRTVNINYEYSLRNVINMARGTYVIQETIDTPFPICQDEESEGLYSKRFRIQLITVYPPTCVMDYVFNVEHFFEEGRHRLGIYWGVYPRVWYDADATVELIGTVAHIHFNSISFPIGWPFPIFIFEGYPLEEKGKLTVETTDEDSIAAYGQRDYYLDLPLSTDEGKLESLLGRLIVRNKDPRVTDMPVTVINYNDEMWHQILERQISDKITLQNTALGIDGNYFINKMEHTISPGHVHEVTWVLEKVVAEYYWTLGLSQLGIGTRLAP